MTARLAGLSALQRAMRADAWVAWVAAALIGLLAGIAFFLLSAEPYCPAAAVMGDALRLAGCVP